MIQQIRLEAFKAFDRLELPFAPLTLLSGLNSSGKSSVLQAFALVRQSLDTRMLGTKDGTELLLNGPLVQLGTWTDVYCEYSRRQPPEIALAFYGSNGGCAEWRAHVESPGADVLPTRFTHDGARDVLYTLIAARFNYLRADRVSPELVYPRSHREVVRNRTLGSRGEFTAHYLTEFRDDIVKNEKVRDSNIGPGLARHVAHWLGQISPDVRLELDAVAGTDYVGVRFGFGSGAGLSGSSSYRATHVGFGLTYTLPVVVALLATPPGGILLLENPEAHVHPRGQAALGVLMAMAASGGVQVVLETHSDHVLNGIRVAAKSHTIARDDIRLHFFSRRQTGEISVESPVVEENGRLSRWPDGFFDQWDRDLDTLLD